MTGFLPYNLLCTMVNLNKKRIVAYLEPSQLEWINMKIGEAGHRKDPVTQKPAGISYILRGIIKEKIEGKNGS